MGVRRQRKRLLKCFVLRVFWNRPQECGRRDAEAASMSEVALTLTAQGTFLKPRELAVCIPPRRTLIKGMRG